MSSRCECWTVVRRGTKRSGYPVPSGLYIHPASSPQDSSDPSYFIQCLARPGPLRCPYRVHPSTRGYPFLTTYHNQFQKSPLYILLFDISGAVRHETQLSHFFLLDNVIITKHVQTHPYFFLTSSSFTPLAFFGVRCTTGPTPLILLCTFYPRGGVSVPSYSLCRPVVLRCSGLFGFRGVFGVVGINRGGMHSITCMLALSASFLGCGPEMAVQRRL